ncbi:MAG: MBOAT family protein [Candidatus Caenarcaniphilales bacterium]|nr:MBOAT family protein [Candidatus Caenarcaniphilales bacterium]
MQIFLASNFLVVFLGLLILASNLAIGYFLPRINSIKLARWIAWSQLFLSAFIVNCLTWREPAGFRMLGICATLFYSCKGIAHLEESYQGQTKLSFVQWLCFALGWFGMRPEIFSVIGKENVKPLEGVERRIFYGTKRFLMGLVFIFIAWVSSKTLNMKFSHILDIVEIHWIVSATMLIGLSLIIHFGIFNFAGAFWRQRGVDCYKLFRDPFHSKSLSEFWARRWNLAFVQIVMLAIYTPLFKRFGPNIATFLGFLFTGLMHDLAISLPVKAGYGLPTLYFAIQGLMVNLEQYLDKKHKAIEEQESISFIWTMGSLILFLPLLFHEAYVRGIIWPLIGYGG